MSQPDAITGTTRCVIVFDAVGTLIHPVPNVIDVYFESSRAYGSSLSKQLVRSRFQTARSKYFHVGLDSNQQFDGVLNSSDEIERQLWWQLVTDVFADLDDCSALFTYLWNHFADHKNWAVFPDVSPAWTKLRNAKCKIAIGSNFDTRLHGICSHYDPLRTADRIFCSAEVGFRKPDIAFYRSVERLIADEIGERIPIVMIGDNQENDCFAPARNGWRTVWLNRNHPPQSGAIQSLVELADELKLDV